MQKLSCLTRTALSAFAFTDILSAAEWKYPPNCPQKTWLWQEEKSVTESHLHSVYPSYPPNLQVWTTDCDRVAMIAWLMPH